MSWMELGRMIVVEGPGAVDFDERSNAIYPVPVGVCRVFEDPVTGAQHFLLRYPPGLAARPHRHTSSHTIVVVSGRLQVNDREIGPGGYCHFPAGETMIHTTAGAEPCVFYTVFDGPVDIEPVD